MRGVVLRDLRVLRSFVVKFFGVGLVGVAGALLPTGVMGQVQVRVGEPGRATYSELHEALRPGTPAADSVLAILHSTSPARLWRQMRA
ncbi:MAG: hypothetical protein ACJ8BF_09730, partial [Gemmatimonadales bacterium]